ncbi:hypothetical protein RJ639_009345 [Escallonia herrerae]|uniref:Uncharacterized protein n=1 Tax=Escallonia herrerae TaxID=1293975 RepID=A0AA89AQ25_9ASTE|nr:hypothetical protein RJ639_009345 [Escallonia herrerae]
MSTRAKIWWTTQGSLHLHASNLRNKHLPEFCKNEELSPTLPPSARSHGIYSRESSNVQAKRENQGNETTRRLVQD